MHDALTPANILQIMFNLMSNAFKFTFKGQIRVRTFIREEEFFVEVSDTGIG
jgi:two-component system, OmpR family, sensor histidine kinase TorS